MRLFFTLSSLLINLIFCSISVDPLCIAKDEYKISVDHEVTYGDRLYEFMNSCRESNIYALFARKLIINGEDYGPAYYKASPIIEGERSKPWAIIYVVPRLDFGKIDLYIGLDTKDKTAVKSMKSSLVTREIFMTGANVRVEHVIVNGIDYGETFIHTVLESF